RAENVARSYSGQLGVTVQLQPVAPDTRTIGCCGVMATNPMSRIGEFGPEKTSATAADTAGTLPSYDCGRRGPGEGPTVIGPSGEPAAKPLPARLQPSPFMSTNCPVAPAVVGSAFRRSWLMSDSPTPDPLNTDPAGQLPIELAVLCQV